MATTAKIAMQIAVVNQKTKSIRSPCFDAWSGSQGMNSATAVAPNPRTTPNKTRRTIAPLPTGREPSRSRRRKQS